MGTSPSGSYAHWRLDNIDYKIGIVLLPGMMVAALTELMGAGPFRLDGDKNTMRAAPGMVLRRETDAWTPTCRDHRRALSQPG